MKHSFLSVMMASFFLTSSLGADEASDLATIWEEKTTYQEDIPFGSRYPEDKWGRPLPQDRYAYLIEGYTHGWWGIPQNIKKAQAIIEQLAKKKDPNALFRQVRGYAFGLYGYPKSPQKAKKINEEMIALGYVPAIERKMTGYCEGLYGYPKNFQKAREMNEALIVLGDFSAMLRRIFGYAYGMNGYPQDRKKAVRLNEDLIRKGDQDALYRKMVGLLRGDEGYSPNPKAGMELINAQVALGNLRAIKLKAEHEKDLALGMQANEALLKKGDKGAQFIQLDGYANGNNGYPKDLQKAQKLVEERAKRGDYEAKITGYAQGLYGFPKDPIKARRLNDKLVLAGNLAAMFRKFYALCADNPDSLYEKNLPEARKLAPLMPPEIFNGYVNDSVYSF